MRVVHVITGLATGGAERSLFNLLRSGSGTFMEPVVVSLQSGGTFVSQLRRLDVPVIEAGMEAPLTGPFRASTVVSAIRKIQPAIVQGWMYHGNAMALFAQLVLGRMFAVAWNIRHCLYSLHDEAPITRQFIRFARFFSNRPAAIVYNSELARTQHEEFGFSGKSSRVIANGFDASEFHASARMREATRLKLGIPTSALVIGHVGRFHPMKDHLLFCGMAREVGERIPDAHFIMCGRGVSYDNATLRGAIPEKLESRFHLLGDQEDVASVVNAFDINCQTSWSEAFPNSVAEALLCEVPCIATDVGDTRKIIGETGVLIRPRDQDELIARVLQLCRLAPSERRSYGHAGRARILREFTMQAVAQEYRGLYRDIVDER